MNSFLQWLSPGRDAARAKPAPSRETKSAPGPFFALHGLAESGWAAGDAGSLARGGFASNPVVYRSVRMIGEAAASLAWQLFIGADEVDAHPALDLLARPNERQSGAVFLEALYGHLLIAGNAYVRALALNGAPREIHLLRPDCVAPVPGADGWPEAYDYTSGNRRSRIAAGGEPPELLHLALFNPVDEVTGLPPMAAARAALDTHNAAARWNKALLDNAARPSGALVYTALEQGNLTEEQFQRLKSELEAGYQGAANAGRPMVLEGGLDWKAMGFSPKDMDFIQAKHGAARDIALAFGVPPMLLGIPGDNTYANYQEANRAFWRQTVLPLAARTAGSLGAWLAAWFGEEDMRLDFDRDRVEALSPDRDGLWTRLNAATFLTVDEKREAAGYGPAEPGDFGDFGQAPGPGPDEGKYNYDPNQRRVPAGSSDGGEWTGGGGGGESLQEAISIHDPWGREPASDLSNISRKEKLDKIEKERKKKITETLKTGQTSGNFDLDENPGADASAPWYALHSMSQVEKHDALVESVSQEYGVDPDLVRAIIYVETTQGWYDIIGEPFDWNSSILPMNIDTDSWGDLLGTREDLEKPEKNIVAGIKLLKAIEKNLGDRFSIPKAGSLYNTLRTTIVTDYGARVEKVYNEKEWEK